MSHTQWASGFNGTNARSIPTKIKKNKNKSRCFCFECVKEVNNCSLWFLFSFLGEYTSFTGSIIIFKISCKDHFIG